MPQMVAETSDNHQAAESRARLGHLGDRSSTIVAASTTSGKANSATGAPRDTRKAEKETTKSASSTNQEGR